MKKRLRAISLFVPICILMMSSVPRIARGYVDDKLLIDPVVATYEGRTESLILQDTLNFRDVSAERPEREAIVRAGALDVVRGAGSGLFMPNVPITNEQVLMAIIRSSGLEGEAMAAGAALKAAGEPISCGWTEAGYLTVAASIGLISGEALTEALTTDASLPRTSGFSRKASATREQIAEWLVKGMEAAADGTFTMPTTYHKVYSYTDSGSIAVDKLPYVEVVTSQNIMGAGSTAFNPRGTLPRAHLAQLMKNMGDSFLTPLGYQKKTGTVGAITHEQFTQTGSVRYITSYYIRTADGKAEVLQYEKKSANDPSPKNKDAVVYNNGEILGLSSLAEGDQIEYFVKPTTNTVYYVSKLSTLSQVTSKGYLVRFDTDDKTITIKDAVYDGKEYTYPLVDGLLTADAEENWSIYIDNKKQEILNLRSGSILELSFNNLVVTKLKYIGEPTLVQETRGVITENEPELGYLTIYDSSGNTVTKKYYENEMQVQKRPYYETSEGIGYIDQMFPNFRYNPNSTTIDRLEPGDFVYFRVDPNDTEVITQISAVTNYVAKYGKVRQLQGDDDGSISILLEYEDKQTSWITVMPDTFVSQDGKAFSVGRILPGDWIRVLVNEAILAPGNTVEWVKEIAVEGSEHFIQTILRGQLAGFNAIQKKISVQNYQTLEYNGWSNYKELEQLDVSANDIEYYMDGRRITLDYALQYLKRGDNEVFIALESIFNNLRVRKVTFRSERSDLLNSDSVVMADGSGSFMLQGDTGSTYTTDAGTIVRRHGRLVDGINITVPDYARVVLSGEGRAAIVDIVDAPDVAGVQIIRGRIKSIDDGKSFTVQSMATLIGNSWNYTPIERTFTIDYSTRFYDSNGLADSAAFIGYGAANKIDAVYTIITDGIRATRVIESPYVTEAVRGTIFNINADSNTAYIKDCYKYDASTGRWVALGSTLTMTVNLRVNDGFIVKNNELVNTGKLQIGEQIRVMTTTLPQRVTEGTAIPGYITFVEK